MTGSGDNGEIRPLPAPDFSREGLRGPFPKPTPGAAAKRFFPLFSKEAEEERAPEKSSGTAREKAQAIIREARRKADEIAEGAYEKGYAQGEKAGYEYGMKKVEGMIQALSEAQKHLEDLHKNMMLTQEKEMISLILFVAKKVIHTETKINPNILSAVLREALEEVPHKEDLHIRLNPMDYEFYKQNVQRFVEKHEALKEAIVESDSRVDLGGVIVDHRMGSVDARLSRQYEKIEKLFVKILEENQKEGRTL